MQLNNTTPADGDLYYWDDKAKSFKPCQIESENVVLPSDLEHFEDSPNVKHALIKISDNMIWKFQGYATKPTGNFDQGTFYLNANPTTGGHFGWITIKNKWYPFGQISSVEIK